MENEIFTPHLATSRNPETMKLPTVSRNRNSSCPRILCVHPNTELYGSDRVFLSSVKTIRKHFPQAWLTAVVTGEGAITAQLKHLVDEILIEDLFVLRKGLLGLRMIAMLPKLMFSIRRACSLMNQFDITYINTIIMPGYLLASRFRRRPTLVHVHELPMGLTRKMFSALLFAANAHLIYISTAVRQGYDWLGRRKYSVIWNGVSQHPLPLRITNNHLRLLLIGRFNGWKGQILLLDAIAQLPPAEQSRLEVRLLGSAYADREHFEVEIHEKIAATGLADLVTVIPFEPDPTAHYAWANAVVCLQSNPSHLVWWRFLPTGLHYM